MDHHKKGQTPNFPLYPRKRKHISGQFLLPFLLLLLLLPTHHVLLEERENAFYARGRKEVVTQRNIVLHAINRRYIVAFQTSGNNMNKAISPSFPEKDTSPFPISLYICSATYCHPTHVRSSKERGRGRGRRGGGCVSQVARLPKFELPPPPLLLPFPFLSPLRYSGACKGGRGRGEEGKGRVAQSFPSESPSPPLLFSPRGGRGEERFLPPPPLANNRRLIITGGSTSGLF